MEKKKIALVTLIMFVFVILGTTVFAQEAKEIKFVGMEYYEWSNDWYNQVARNFEKNNPDIKIKVETVPWDMGFDRYIVWIKGGEAPDIGTGGAKWTADFKSMDALESLNKYMSAEFLDNLVNPLVDALKFDDQYYALPIAASVRSFFYNKEILAEVGISEPPKTWDDFINVAQSIKEQVPNVYPLALNLGDHEAIWNVRHFQLAAGGELVDELGNWKVDTPENEEVIQFIKKIVDLGYVQEGCTGASREEVQQLFIQEQAAMITENPELITRIEEANPGLKFDVAPFPQLRAPGELSVIDTIYMFKDSKNKPEAWKFLEYLLSYDVHLDWVRRTGFFGVTKDVGRVWPEGELRRKFVEMMSQAKMYPIGIGWEVVQEEFVNAVIAVILDTMNAREALVNAQNRIQRRIEK